MADMSLDELLSSSIKSAAEPAASAGVADAIRSRVAAGDAGTSVAGSTAPGWGGGASGVLTIVAPIALIVVAGVVGGALGASGLLGVTPGPASGDIPTYVINPDTAPVYSCPGGPQVGAIPASTRVLAVARDADGAFLGARNPDDLTSTIWFATGDLVLDADSPDPASLPIGECPEVTVTVVTPTPDAGPSPSRRSPSPRTSRQPPRDTTAPQTTKMTAEPDAGDQRPGIARSRSTRATTSASPVSRCPGRGRTASPGARRWCSSPGTWRYTWSYANLSNGFGNWTFTARATDAAGNQSAPRRSSSTGSTWDRRR